MANSRKIYQGYYLDRIFTAPSCPSLLSPQRHRLQGPNKRLPNQSEFIPLHILGFDNDGGKPKYQYTRSQLKNWLLLLQTFVSLEVWTSSEK